MNGRFGPPQRDPLRRGPSDPRAPLQQFGPMATGPPQNVGGRFARPPGGRGSFPPHGPPGGRFNGGRGQGPSAGRFGNDRTVGGRGHGDARAQFAGRGMRGAGHSFPGRGRGRGPLPPPPPPPPPGRGAAVLGGRGMPGRGIQAGGRGRGPMGPMQGQHPQPRGVPPPPPIRAPQQRMAPPPPPGRGHVRQAGPLPQYSQPHPQASRWPAPQPGPPPGSHPLRQSMPPSRQPPVVHPPPQGYGHAAGRPITNGHHPAPHHMAAAPTAQPQSVRPSSSSAAVPGKPAADNQSAYTKEQVDGAWSEHTAPNSSKYYFNSITQESTYTKPDYLTEKESGRAEVEAKATQKASSWAEYTDPSTGKKYYSDGVSTTWERPAEMMGEGESNAEEEGQAAPPKKKKRKRMADTEMPEFHNKAEATAAFKGLLLAKDVQPTTKWNEVVKMCSSDSRWEACEVLSLGERKQALAEYQTKRANELRTLERQERMRAKEAFLQLLTEKLPTVAEFSATNSHFADMREFLATDDRFYAVEKEDIRETLFLDFCEEVRKREERKKRSKKREAKDEFLAFLKERQDEGLLTFASTWDSFVGTLEERQRRDPRFQASQSLPDSERELCFADYVLELQATEEERRRRIRDARRRAEKAQKEAFIDALRTMASDGSLVPSTRWHAAEGLVSTHPSFAPVQSHERDSPREIFEDFIDDWKEVYRRDRSFMSNLVHSTPEDALVVDADTTYVAFSKTLLDLAAHSPDLYSEMRGILNREDLVSSARLYYNEMVSKAKEDSSKTAKSSKSGSRRTSADSSSEDEGEIREDGELSDDEA